MRKWRPASAPVVDDWRVVYQIVVPKNYCGQVLELAHSTPMAGHLVVNKTYNRIQTHFYWPGIKKMYNSSLDPVMCASWLENLIRKCW